MKLIPRIREKRMEAHMSQKELAEKLNMSVSQLSRIESGKTHPLPRTLWEIAKACNCKVDNLYESLEE